MMGSEITSSWLRIIGSAGTGDQTIQAPFTVQSLRMLIQLGITVPQGAQLQLINVAAVMVTVDLPPFADEGRPWTSPFLPSPCKEPSRVRWS